MNARAMRHESQPRVRVGPEKPYPGNDGATTWNVSVRRGMTSRNSTIEPGQPWMSSSGSAFSFGERACTK